MGSPTNKVRAGASPSNGGRPNSRLEREAWKGGFQHIAGVDEVGRGCLFGPVVAAAVILDPARPIRGLNDSKLLSPQRREVLSERIRERAAAFAIGSVDSEDIDRINIYQASRRAMLQAVQALEVEADFLLVDAMKLDLDLPQKALIRGDARSSSIAAASIVAKVERDGWMRRWDEIFPGYGLASNKGYSSPQHLAALEKLGPTSLHRRSFRPVAEAARASGEPPPASSRQYQLFAPREVV